MAEPKYVRLRTGLNGRYDLGSGWGISGLDVKPMPDKESRPNAHAYVKGEINAGRLEGCSKAEYDETQVSITGDDDDDDTHQERSVRTRAAAAHSKILASRTKSGESIAAEADEARRKDILKKQNKAKKGKAAAEDDDDDDDAESDSYDEMKKGDLVTLADTRDIDSSGTADDIRGRLREADAEAGDDGDESDEDTEDDEESEDDESEDDESDDGESEGDDTES